MFCLLGFALVTKVGAPCAESRGAVRRGAPGRLTPLTLAPQCFVFWDLRLSPKWARPARKAPQYATPYFFIQEVATLKHDFFKERASNKPPKPGFVHSPRLGRQSPSTMHVLQSFQFWWPVSCERQLKVKGPILMTLVNTLD